MSKLTNHKNPNPEFDGKAIGDKRRTTWESDPEASAKNAKFWREHCERTQAGILLARNGGKFIGDFCIGCPVWEIDIPQIPGMSVRFWPEFDGFAYGDIGTYQNGVTWYTQQFYDNGDEASVVVAYPGLLTAMGVSLLSAVDVG